MRCTSDKLGSCLADLVVDDRTWRR